MSYSDIYECSQDPDFRQRVQVAVLTEQIAPAGAAAWVTQHALDVAAVPGIASAWEYSKVGQPYHSRRGYDPSVLTDTAIRDAVIEVAASNEPS